MHIGASVYKIENGVAYSGKVTEIKEDSLVFTTPDGVSHSATKGEAHRYDKLGSLAALGFTRAKSDFKVGTVVADKTTGVLTQITNSDISGAVTTLDGSVVQNPAEKFFGIASFVPDAPAEDEDVEGEDEDWDDVEYDDDVEDEDEE